jgi:hypothetical protein
MSALTRTPDTAVSRTARPQAEGTILSCRWWDMARLMRQGPRRAHVP